MDDLELLTRVRRRLEKPEAWTQGVYARDANGKKTLWVDSPSAVCWCLAGAAMREDDGEDDDYCAPRVATALGFGTPKEMAKWNDAATHADVLARLDAAIKERS